MLRVGHVGLQVPDLDASIEFAVRILGLRVSERDDRLAYLSCNARHHELSLHAGERSALDHIAFEVDRETFDVIQARVDAIERGETGVEDAFRFVAPGGFAIEVFHGMAHDQPAHYVSVAPRPVKFEHVTVKSTRKDELEALLIDVLGLRLSDRAEDAVSWLRANERRERDRRRRRRPAPLRVADRLVRHVRPRRRPPAQPRRGVPVGSRPPRHRRQLLLLLPRRRRRRGRVLGRDPAHRGRGALRPARVAGRAADRQPLGQPGAAGGVRRSGDAPRHAGDGGMSPFALTGRTALVTGAGRVLGRAIAVALAQAGADVTAVSRTEADLETLAERRALPCDVTDPDALAALPDADILVASAGTNVPEPFLEVEPETFDRILGLNLRATFFTAQAVARGMAARGRGSIVLVSSQMGHVGAPNRTVYCASKHAIEGLTKALAVELAPQGVRVNAVAPTYIRTPMTAPFFQDDAFRAATEAAIPLGRIGEPADVAGAVVFLCSPAARLVTGTSLVVDGGYTAQ